MHANDKYYCAGRCRVEEEFLIALAQVPEK
jgi:hypothetical protein